MTFEDIEQLNSRECIEKWNGLRARAKKYILEQNPNLTNEQIDAIHHFVSEAVLGKMRKRALSEGKLEIFDRWASYNTDDIEKVKILNRRSNESKEK